MIRTDFRGDFLGFTFGDTHSSILGIVRTSSSDRFTEGLHPEIKDKTAEVPGLNGQYYFGSDFGVKNIKIDFSFDSLTESEFRKLRTVFGTKEIQKLIFDESPYKYYLAKVDSPIELSYICFDEFEKQLVSMHGIRYKTTSGDSTTHTVYRSTDNKERIYKGDGSISFTCYYPFAKSQFKWLPTNIDSSGWAVSSGILSAENFVNASLDTWIEGETVGDEIGYIKLYNPGDLETGFRLFCPFTNNHTYPNNFEIIERLNTGTSSASNWISERRLVFNQITRQGSDTGFIIDTNNNLVFGVSGVSTTSTSINYTTTGTLYNKFIKSGEFFKIKPTDLNNTYQRMIATIHGNEDMRIYYDYLYF